MSREIRFRAWDKVNNRFDEHVYINSHSEVYKDLDPFGVDMSGNRKIRLTIERYEIQQYTGLKDKNDVEIWEGDVIDLFWPFVGITYTCVVVWHQQFGRWAMQEQMSGVYHYFGSQDTNLMNIERIGNIYQHPHLISKS